MDNFDSKNTNKTDVYDLIVVGGGPAGMMTALRAGERGKKVLLIEKNESLGKKLRITGGGRCNLTNAEFDTRVFLSHFRESDKFLFSPFSQFGVQDTLDFFNSRGCPTKIEDRKRVFPLSDSAESVWNVLIEELSKNKVEVLLNSEVNRFVMSQDGRTIKSLELKNKKILKANAFAIATGGKSKPETGSTGDGFSWLIELGHNVIEPRPSLVPLVIKESFVKDLQGITLPEVKVNVFQNGKKQKIFEKETAVMKTTGRLLFTHFGISGPLILNMSKTIDEYLDYGEVVLKLDLVPALAHDALNAKLQEVFLVNAKKKIKNSLSEIVPSNFVETLLKIVGIDQDVFCSSITREMRILLIDFLKAFPLTVKELAKEEKAIVTSGGVALEEVDFKTMRSKKVDNLFLVGDVLNIDRPSGGFSLQLCWTTGFVAGSHV
jgi:predicted Rossmann fold flavoprotein